MDQFLYFQTINLSYTLLHSSPDAKDQEFLLGLRKDFVTMQERLDTHLNYRIRRILRFDVIELNAVVTLVPPRIEIMCRVSHIRHTNFQFAHVPRPMKFSIVFIIPARPILQNAQLFFSCSLFFFPIN